MCYTGGPRCASHVREEILQREKQLAQARKTGNDNEVMECAKKLAPLEREYRSTPTGQKKLQATIDKLKESGNDREAESFKVILQLAVELRQHDMNERRKRIAHGEVLASACSKQPESTEEEVIIRKMDQEAAKGKNSSTKKTRTVKDDGSRASIEQQIKDRAKELYTDPHPGKKGDELIRESCYNCNGTGNYQGYTRIQYSVTNAEGSKSTYGCFKCRGVGHQSRKVSSIRASARRTAKQRATDEFSEKLEAITKAEQAAASADAVKKFSQEHPGLVEGLDTIGDFGSSLKGQLIKNGTLTERQVTAAKEAIERQKEYAARKEAEPKRTPVVEGRGEITGSVLSVQMKHTDFGSVWKMKVADDRGFHVWGSVPTDLELEKGDRVKFTGTVKASENDNTFGFFSRPAKAEIL